MNKKIITFAKLFTLVLLNYSPLAYTSEPPQSSLDQKESFACSVCPKTYAQKRSLKQHVKIQHSSNKIYSCTTCNKIFKDIYTLRRHKETHNNIRPFQCDHCHRSFKRRYHLTRHKKTCKVLPPSPSVQPSIQPLPYSRELPALQPALPAPPAPLPLHFFRFIRQQPQAQTLFHDPTRPTLFSNNNGRVQYLVPVTAPVAFLVSAQVPAPLTHNAP